MITLRPGSARGSADHGWLRSQHSFSFADYYDPRYMGFGALRVINEDRVAPGTGFGTHGHRDMEIVSYVLDGELEHKDSLGNGSLIRPGDVQRMSAGKGVLHSEFNGSRERPVHFLQIWIEPSVKGGKPTYEQTYFGAEEKRGRLRLIASPDGRDGSVRVQQDAQLFAGLFDGGERAEHRVTPGRRAYVHVARGRILANGHALDGGDALMATEESRIVLERGEDAEVLVFDLA